MKTKIKFILVNILLITILLGINSVVVGKEDYYENTSETEEIEYSEEYLEWEKLSDKEKKNTLEPRKEVIPFDTLYENEKISENEAQTYNFEKPETNLRDSGVIFFMAQEEEETRERINEIPTSFNLSSETNLGNIRAELQSPYNTCYAYPALNAIETNLELTTGNEYDFSEMHIEYITSTLLGGDRELDAGGNFETVMNYSFAKQGPVLESDIPKRDYTEDEYDVLENAVQIAQVYSYKNFPTINKIKNTYSTSELNEFRNVVKSHIMNYGAIFAGMYFCTDENELNYYDPDTYAYSCIETDTTMNHAITIVGWDDGYSKENFAEANRPSNDGAYIAINSWGESWGDNGYFYISYEDVWIEYNMSGVIQVEELGPQIGFSNYTKTDSNISVQVNVTDSGKSGIDATSLKYLWTSSDEVPDESEFTNTFTNGETIEIDTTENLKLYVLAKNNKGIATIDIAFAFDGGNGTVENPYLISTAMQLGAIRNNLSASYKLLNDIDLSFATQTAGGRFYNSGYGWEPIGTSSQPFTGTLDGNGYSIIDIYGHCAEDDRDGDDTADGAGLFGTITGTVENIGINNSSISTYDTVGGIAGVNKGTIENTYVSGILEGSINVGGIVGKNSGIVKNSYNIASVLGQTCIGGIVGINNTNAQILNVYNVGHVGGSLEETVANVVGQNDGTIQNAYYINEVLNSIGIDNGASENINNVSIDDMKNENTYSGFDFSNVWNINNSEDYIFATLKTVTHVEKEEDTENFAGGNGTLYNPYLISTPEQLDYVRYNMYANYMLTNNIDLKYDTQNENGLFYDDGKGWIPIGNLGTVTTGNTGYTQNYLNAEDFKGVFDGNGYSILNLFINRDDLGQALFTNSRGVLENFGLANMDITGGTYSSGIVYKNYFIVQQVYTTGITNGDGGIVGSNSGIIRNAFNTAYTHNGNGIAGECRGDYIVIENVYNAGRIAFVKKGDESITKCPSITEISPGSHIKMQNVYSLNNEINTELMYIAYNNEFGEVSEDISNVKVLTREELSQHVNLVGFNFENTWEMIETGDYKIPVLKNVKYIDSEENKVDFAGGNGTYYNPYKISTPEHLNNVRDYLNKNFILINDIDLQESLGENGFLYNEGKGFEPIGNQENPFIGYFNGNKNKIINLKIYNDELKSIGLFGHTDEAVITNLKIINSNIKVCNEEKNYVGNIAGSIYRTILSNVGASGNIYDGFYVGGICGETHCSLIEKSYNYSSVNSSENYVGGLVGHNNTYYGNSLIYDCYNAGIVGFNKSSSTTYNGSACGICGNGCPILKNIYNIGTVSTDAYTAGAIISSGYLSNLEGDVYYLDEGIPVYPFAEGSIENVFSKTKDEMKLKDTFVGFDFENIWEIEEGRFPTIKGSGIVYPEVITIKNDFKIGIGFRKNIEYTVSPDYAMVPGVEFNVSDATIATVSETGKILGIEPGEMTLNINTKDDAISANGTILVLDKVWNISSKQEKENVIAVLDEKGKLSITGEGAMRDYGRLTSGIPWKDYAELIIEAEVQEGITNFSGDMFENCTNLTKANIPETITKISERAFYGCSSLTSLVIPEGVESIEASAFSGCTALANINMPSNLSTIKGSAFYGCKSLTNLLINDSVEEIGASAFYGCSSLKTITLPRNISIIKQELFRDCKNLESITIPESVTTIDYRAFYNCDSLTEVVMPDSVVSVGNEIFYGCDNLENVIISKNISTITEYMFDSCSKLTSIDIPENVSSIEKKAFNYCTNLDNITIPKNVNSIGENVFNACKNLNSINVYCNSYAEEYVTTNYSDKLSVIHNYEEESRVEATYEEDGKITYKCTTCDDTYEEVIPKLEMEITLSTISVTTMPKKTEYIQNVEELDLTDGKITLTYNDNSTEEIDITAEGVNVTGFDNTSIGEKTLTVTYLDKTATFVVTVKECSHNYGEWTTTKDATCDEVGSKERTCTICNNIETEEITALGHSYNSETIEETCTAQGYTKHTCATCGNTYNDNYIPASHKSVTDEGKNATCTDKGLTEGSHCSVCNEILVAQEEIAALGHDYGEWNVVKSATYKEVGEKTRNCSRCPNVETEEIPILEPIETYDVSATTTDNVTARLYEIDSTYMIVINGTGNMKDFARASDVPWDSYCGPYSSDLTKVVIEEGVENVGDYSFATQYGLKELELSNTVTSIGSNAFTWCKFTDLIMPDSVTSLGESAFYGCTITNLKLSNNLKEITADAFHDTEITELEIPSSVEVIGESAFNLCSGLTYVYIPENVKTIESQAFTNCRSLKFVEIASGVTSIGSQAFTGCESLEKITIPSNVETIGSSTGDYWNIVDDSENVTVYFKNGSAAEEYFAQFDKTTVVDDNKPVINSVDITETDWTNQDVTITINATDELSGLSKYAYSFDGGVTWQEENYKIYSKYTEGIVIKVKDCLYNTETYSETITVYIDKVNPEIQSVFKSKEDWTNQNVTLTVNATDDLSGFGAKSYSFDGGATWQESNEKEYTENTSGIKVIIKDKAGNVVEYPETIDITNIDKVDPSIRLVSGEREACISTTITVNATDDLSGFGAKSYSFDNGATWQESNEKEYTESAENVIIQVKDQAGNTVTYQESINIVISHNEVIDRAVEATCTKDGLTEGKHCSRCEEVLIAQEVVGALGHEEVIDNAVEATCTKGGLTEGKHCSRCDEVLVAQEVVDALGHNHETVVTDATCTEKGYTTHSCTRCNDEYVDTYTDALGHDYKIKSKDEAVCEQGGKIVYECSRCNDSYEETIEPTGHTVVTDQRVEPTCTNTGLTEGSHCSKCKEVLVEQEVIDALGHDYENTVTEPTCTEQGYTTYNCKVCTHSYVDNYVDATGHTVVTDNAVAPTCTETGLTEGSHCSVCNTVLEEQQVVNALGHDYERTVTNPTCTEKGYTTYNCKACTHSYVDNYVDAKGHTVVTDSAVDATCTETGLTEGSHCSVCDTVLVKQEIVDALGHDIESVVTEPTCTEQGYTTYNCKVCTHSYVDNYVDAKGHTVVTDNAVAPTCTETGLTEGSHCSVCDTVIVAQEVVKELGHTVVTDDAVEATCTETGLTEGSHCSVCDTVLVAQEEVPKKEHSYENWVTIVDATCEENGKEERNCANCVAKEERAINKLGHNYAEEWTVDLDPTCTEKGSKSHHCTRCDSRDSITEIEANGHTYGEWTTTSEASCEAVGSKERTCSVCTNVETQEITALGHDYNSEVIEPNCTEGGYTTHTCTRCSDNYIDGETEALGHSYETVTTNSSCTEGGYTTYKCTKCSHEYVDDNTDSLGHDYVVKERIEETCTEAGNIVYECSRCEDSYNETIQAKGHTEVVDEAVSATCTEKGLTAGKHCSVCEEILVAQEEVAALGHNFGAWVIDKEATYEEEGHKYRICVNCNEEREEEIIPKLTKEEIQITTTYDVREIENNKYITLTESSKIADIIKNMTSNSDIEIVDKDGNVLDKNSKVGTGAKVITKEDEKVQYTVVLQGDVNSDGEITFKDIIRTNAIRINNGENDIIKAQLLAADINNTNKIEFRDIILLNAIRINAIKN